MKRKTKALKPPRLTQAEILACLRIGALEYAANVEYQTNGYHHEKGGPALARLNEARDELQKLKKTKSAPAQTGRRGVSAGRAGSPPARQGRRSPGR